jgi:hypothetical protein
LYEYSTTTSKTAGRAMSRDQEHTSDILKAVLGDVQTVYERIAMIISVGNWKSELSIQHTSATISPYRRKPLHEKKPK